MWISVGRAAVGLVALTFMAWLTRSILDPVLSFATAGEYSDQTQVVELSSYFGALTLQNLTLAAGLAVGIYLLGRAAAERRVR